MWIEGVAPKVGLGSGIAGYTRQWRAIFFCNKKKARFTGLWLESWQRYHHYCAPESSFSDHRMLQDDDPLFVVLHLLL
jgi:hypothetical protein